MQTFITEKLFNQPMTGNGFENQNGRSLKVAASIQYAGSYHFIDPF
jgi:hypothetical protein